MAHNLKSLLANPDIHSDPESSSIQATGQESYHGDTGTLCETGPIETHADLLSALPFEVTSHIFYHACKPTFHRNQKWQRDCDPLLLGQLSRRYRQYAWATSELWSTIIIQLIPSKVAAQTELLEEWLARTMGRPIDIYFEIQTRVPMQMLLLLSKPRNNNQPPIVPMINLLAEHSSYWRFIDFRIPSLWYPFFASISNEDSAMSDNEVTLPVSTKNPLNLPLLTSASFHRDDLFPLIHKSKRVGLDLTLAPSLRTLSLRRFEMSTIIFEGINVKQITTLALDHAYNIDLHEFLPRLPNLQVLLAHSATFRQNITRTITHQKLCKLEIDTSQDHQLLFPIFYVILPGLKSLGVSISSTMDYSRVFRRFASPDSESHLTRLSLSCVITRESDLIDVLSALDSLRELHIRDTSTEATPDFGLSRTFFDVLHPDEDAPYLPSLEVFSYEGNLVVQAIDFLEPLLIRSRMREGCSRTDGNLERIAVLRRVKIQADQLSDSAEFSIAEYPDTQYVWEVMMMIEQGVLELITMDGELWE